MYPVITIMIKNEEEKICDTLLPFINANYDKYLIYDTGSTDNTVSVVRNFLESHNRTFYIIEEEFIDFSTSRNRALDHTKTYFNDEKYTLMFDCEWYVHNPEGIVEFCKTNQVIEDSYYINVKTSNITFARNLLFTVGGNARYRGKVHEYVVGSCSIKLNPDIYFLYNPTSEGLDRTSERHKRDLKLLENEHDEPRNCFYLAQTYHALGDIENAIKYYEKRATLAGFVEEAFIALYRIGRIYSESNWDLAQKYFLKAYNFRKTRIEPLIEIIHHQNDPKFKYQLAKLACSVGISTDILFVETEVYRVERWKQLSFAANQLELYQEAYDAIKKIPFTDELSNYCSELIKKVKPPKILNLILYSHGDEYQIMYEILSAYLEYNKIQHLFYTFGNETKLENNILYLKGEESMVPGILEKTILAFEFTKEYDYDFIVRSNISTLVDFNKLSIPEIDYGGPLYYYGSFVDIPAGLTEEKHQLYGKYHFVSGICIILSKKCVNWLLENKESLMSYGIIDDVAIGICIGSIKNDLMVSKTNDKISWNLEEEAVVYRNKTDDRMLDVKRMFSIVKTLI